MAEEHGRPAGWRYRLHGFTVGSALELRELVPEENGDCAPDVTLRLGPVSGTLGGAVASGACHAARAGEMMFWLRGTARFLVTGGREIVVDPAPDAAAESLRALVLSSPVSALLLQRGLLPLHASAVATADGAVAILGSAAAGKSTLAAALAQRGLMPLSDDIAAVLPGAEGRPMLLPGYPVLRLWPDACAALGLESAGVPLRPGVDKRVISFPGLFPTEARPLAAIYVLSRRVPAGLSAPLAGAEAFAAVLDGVHRLAFAQGMGFGPQVFRQVAALARAVPVIPLTGGDPADLAQRVSKAVQR